MVKSCFFHLRLLAKVKPFLSTSNFEKLIHAFIFRKTGIVRVLEERDEARNQVQEKWVFNYTIK